MNSQKGSIVIIIAVLGLLAVVGVFVFIMQMKKTDTNVVPPINRSVQQATPSATPLSTDDSVEAIENDLGASDAEIQSIDAEEDSVLGIATSL